MRNNGTSTWTAQDGYRLGTVDDQDPFTSNNRVELANGASVAPGQTYDFTVTLAAPSLANMYTTDWRMLREGIHWFGVTGAQQINVGCNAAPPFDLAQVVIQSSRDVRDFARTSEITSLEFRPDNIHLDHTLRGQWPPVVINPADGTTQEATIWVFFAINGTWYGTGGERLRPNQTDKQLTNASDIGPGWLYDSNRWGPMTNYVPQVGELVGFMVVAGSTRSDDNVAVQERTGVVLIPFPANGITASYPPFAWVEP